MGWMENHLTETKICSRCRLPKKLDEFYTTKNTLTGRRSACKDCYVKEQERRAKGQPITKHTKPYHIVRSNGMKLCSTCGHEKEVDKNFYRTAKGTYYAHCNECQSKMARLSKQRRLDATRASA